MIEPQQGFAIGVDLGTSNTVAVMRWADGRTRPLLIDGGPIMTSGVYVDEAGRLHVGRDAVRLASFDPSRFEPNPKRRIDESGVLLGDREVPIVDLLAALLGAVARAAVEAAGFLPPAVLTHPAAWGTRRRETLVAAASRAGWPPVRLVPEPVAATRYFVNVLRRPVPAGASLAVFDFGGGTLDIAVVRNENGRFNVLGSGGIEDLGGLDIDAALVEHLGIVLDAIAPQVRAALRHPDTTTQRRDRRLFWDDVRGAKEMLSRATVAPIAVPGRDQAIHLTREELERVAGPLLRRAVFQTDSVIKDCGLRPDQLAGLFLVGGSSRLPLVARLLHAELGIAPTVLEQPELPVAEGALAEVLPPQASTTYPTQTEFGGSAALVSTHPATPMPVSPSFGGAPTSPSSPAPAAVSAAPASGGGLYSSSTARAPGSPASGLPPPGYHGQPPTGAPHPPGPPATAAPTPLPGVRAWYNRPVTWIIAAAAVVLVAAVATLVFILRDDTVAEVDFATLRSEEVPVEMGDSADIDATASAALGDRAYYGWAANDTFHIGVIDIPGQRRLGDPVTIAADLAKWTIYPTPRGLFAVGTGSGGPGMLYLLDPGTARERSHTAFEDQDRLYAYESGWVLYSSQAKQLTGRSWSTGEVQWTKPDPQNGAVLVYESTKTDLRGPATLDGSSTERDIKSAQRLVQVGYDKKIRLIDARKGDEVRTWIGVGDLYDRYLAHDGKLYVASDGTQYRLHMYDLNKSDEPQSIYSAKDDKRTVVDFSPCGDGRFCLLDASSYDGADTQVVAIDVVKRKEVWRRDASGADRLVAVGQQILATSLSGTAVSYLYSEDGTQLLSREDKEAVGTRLNGSSLLFFTGSLSTYASSDISLHGVQAVSGQRTALGPLPKTRGTSCSWTDEVIICATETKFEVWRFTSS